MKRLLEKIVALGDKFHPAFGALEVTSRCNASCKYCYIDKQRADEDLPTDKIFHIIDRFDAAGLLDFTITGGEPFLRDDILEILAYGVGKNFFRINILTNGMLLDERHIRFLGSVKEHLGPFQISLFSHLPSIHDDFVGVSGAFARSLDAGKQLLGAGVKVRIALNIVASNLDSFVESRTLFEKYGFEVVVSYAKLLLSGRPDTYVESMTTTDFYESYLQNLPPSETVQYKRRLEKQKCVGSDPVGLCEKMHCGVSVDSRGNIRPCTAFRNLSIANLFEDQRSLHEILAGAPISSFIKTFRKSDIPQCRECVYVNYCVVCLGAMHTQFGDFKQPPPQTCNFAKTLSNLKVCA